MPTKCCTLSTHFTLQMVFTVVLVFCNNHLYKTLKHHYINLCSISNFHLKKRAEILYKKTKLRILIIRE